LRTGISVLPRQNNSRSSLEPVISYQ
jgi:hypothetical protein